MKLLMILLAVMTWTVESKNSVSGEGTWPYSIEVDYSCSYQKGTVRAGDEATLTLSGLGGITVEKVVMHMKANKSSGAGILTILANDKQIVSRSIDYQDLPVTEETPYYGLSVVSNHHSDVNSLVIRLTGSENSLYIEKYEITYSVAAPRSVTLMKGSQVFEVLIEDAGGVGVMLPSMKDTAEWQFIGWTPANLWSTNEKPELYSAGNKFYPKSDCTLWAAYQYHKESKPTYVTDLVSGTYMYVNSENNLALKGVPNGGVMGYKTIDGTNENLHYHVDFVSPDTAYITHVMSSTPIGNAGTEIVEVSTPWLVYHDGEETLFFVNVDKKPYVLWFDLIEGCAKLLQTAPMSSPMRLMNIPAEDSDPVYTCHPETPLSIGEVETQRGTGERVVMQFGNYDLIIKNGEKQLRIR